MFYILAFRSFLSIFGRVGHVSIKALMDDSKMSRSTANRYMKAMMDAKLVKRIGHGKYVLVTSDDVLNGCARAVTPMEFWTFHTYGSVNGVDAIPF